MAVELDSQLAVKLSVSDLDPAPWDVMSLVWDIRKYCSDLGVCIFVVAFLGFWD